MIGRLLKICLFDDADADADCKRPGTGVDIVDIEIVAAADAFDVAAVVPIEVVVDFANGCAVVDCVACSMMAAFEHEETKVG